MVATDEACRDARTRTLRGRARSCRGRDRQRDGRRGRPRTRVTSRCTASGATRRSPVLDSADDEQCRGGARRYATGPARSRVVVCHGVRRQQPTPSAKRRKSSAPGRADVMIAGGTDAPIVPGIVRAGRACACWPRPPAEDPVGAVPSLQPGSPRDGARAKAPERSSWSTGITPPRAARRSSPRSRVTARPRMPDISRSRARMRPRRAIATALDAGGAGSRRTSITSTRTVTATRSERRRRKRRY